MSLTQLECSLEKALGDSLFAFLEDEAFSVSLVETNTEFWNLQVITDSSRESALRHKITLFLEEKACPVPKITSLPLSLRDWVKAVHHDFPPLTVGCFYIHGSHIQDAPPPNFLSLHIDAATAFGSGDHESTQGCLRALTLLSSQHSFQTPLDMGCGSGILALAMAKLWKVPVMACDNDPESVRVTHNNAQINHLESLVMSQTSEGFSSLKGKTFDIITANILANPLCEMAKDAVQALTPKGVIILSGLLNTQAKEVIKAYQNAGAKLLEPLDMGEWSTLIMQKTSHG